MNKRTPGSWKVEGSYVVTDYWTDDNLVAQAIVYRLHPDVAAANLALIAAAPDWKAAALESHRAQWDDNPDIKRRADKLVEHAIKKERGDSTTDSDEKPFLMMSPETDYVEQPAVAPLKDALIEELIGMLEITARILEEERRVLLKSYCARESDISSMDAADREHYEEISGAVSMAVNTIHKARGKS